MRSLISLQSSQDPCLLLSSHPGTSNLTWVGTAFLQPWVPACLQPEVQRDMPLQHTALFTMRLLECGIKSSSLLHVGCTCQPGGLIHLTTGWPYMPAPTWTHPHSLNPVPLNPKTVSPMAQERGRPRAEAAHQRGLKP